MTLISSLQSHLNQTRSKWLDIDSTTLYSKASADRWSRIEILGHLIDSARYNLQRFTEAPLAEDSYQITGYKQVELVSFMDYQHQDATSILDLWLALNQCISTIWQSYTDETWRKQIIIKGELYDLQFLAEDYVNHMADHLHQIFDGIDLNPTLHGISLEAALTRFRSSQEQDGKPFVELMQYGDLSIEYYKPNKIDHQQPHTRDEVYIIISGSGQLIIGETSHPFKQHDIFFVKAGEPHKFDGFSDDFATWVVFYGFANSHC